MPPTGSSRRPLARALVAAAAALACAGVAALAVPGDLDHGFGGDGRAVLASPGRDSGNAVAVQPDGRILVAGSGGPDTAVTVTRLLPDGTPDTGFGAGGTRRVDLGGDEVAAAIALQPDGRIVVAGRTSVGANVLIARLTPDGGADSSFGPGGVRIIDYGGNDSAQALALEPDGRILVAGTGGSGTAMMVTSLNVDGTPDATFDGDGTAGINVSSRSDIAYGVVVQHDGRVVLAGAAGTNGVVTRFTRNGAIDGEFGIAGTRVVDHGGTDLFRAIALQPDGRLVVAGRGGRKGVLALSRLNPDGSLDRSFDGDGSTGFPGRSDETGGGVAVQRNGKIVVAGASHDDMLLARFQPGGEPDTTFGRDGRRLLQLGGDDSLAGVALASDGDIVAAGSTTAGDGDVAVVRATGDPAARVPLCRGRVPTIVGTPGRDVLAGTRGRDVVAALDGNDVVRTGSGDDVVCGGGGRDRVDGGPGDDRIAGQGGADDLRGGTGRDELVGGRGRDACTGGPGRDTYTCERITGG